MGMPGGSRPPKDPIPHSSPRGSPMAPKYRSKHKGEGGEDLSHSEASSLRRRQAHQIITTAQREVTLEAVRSQPPPASTRESADPKVFFSHSIPPSTMRRQGEDHL
jgi:hypothetical protein